MTDEMLGLLDSLFMVRTFRIAQPGFGLPLIQPLQYNDDEVDNKFTDTPFDSIFEMIDNKIFPLAIHFIFFSGWHYDTVLLKHDRKSPLFRIGTPLPDILYKMMNLIRSKWESISLDAVLEHNKKC